MKKHLSRFHTKKVAMIAGAASLAALVPQVQAQSAGDALINKLEQKGILSADEAKELRVESQQDYSNSFTNSFDKSFAAKVGTPDWVTGYKLTGDVRARIDDTTVSSPYLADRWRERYRLRVGLAVNMKDDLAAGFRLITGDYPSTSNQGGSPLSGNTTMQDNGSKKSLYVDAAYGKWSPHGDNWTVSTIVGKMDQPFQVTPMEFDADYTPEGLALQSTYKLSDSQALAFNSGAFVLDNETPGTGLVAGTPFTSRDPFVYGFQLILNSKWSPKVESSVGVSIFDIASKENLGGANVQFINQGNTRNSSTNLVNNYNPIVGSGSITYKLDSFPLYNGQFPVKLAGEFMDNPGASKNNEGYWGGVTLGKSGKKGTWDVSYRYQYLEADAWYDQLVDDDNSAFYVASPGAGQKSGVMGGTNVKGHLVKFNYSITDSLVFSTTCYVNSLINVPTHSPTVNPESDEIHFMADLMWKF